jgi:WD40 repeat protein
MNTVPALPAAQASLEPDPSEGPVFDAFISYRHLPSDRVWARWIQRELETYRIPGNVVAREHPKRRLRPVFRDEDELPAVADLSDEIRAHLRRSRFLVVVCSPSTPASRWIDEEIRYFVSLGRGDRVLALLVEGEPADSFPSALRELGGLSEHEGATEPLAADVRPGRLDPESGRRESTRERKRLEKLRIAARIIGCRFDELRRRDQERRIRRRNWQLAGLTSLVGVLSVAVLLVLGMAGIAVKNGQRAQESAAESRRRLVTGLTENGIRAAGADDPGRALVYYAGALQADSAVADARRGWAERLLARWARSRPAPRDTAAERMLRLRFGTVLRRFPPLLHVLPPEAGKVSAALSPDGRCLLTASDSAPPRVWTMDSGRPCPGFAPGAAPAQAVLVRYDASGRRFLTREADGRVRVWDARTGRSPWPAIQAARPGASPEWTSFSPDGERLLVPVGEGSTLAALVDVETGRTLRLFGRLGTAPDVNFAAFSPDGRLVVTGDWSGAAQVWDTGTGRMRGRAMAHPDVVDPSDPFPVVEHAAFSPDGSRVVTASMGGWARVWNTGDGSPVTPPLRHTEQAGAASRDHAVLYAAYSPSGRHVATAGNDGMVRVWDAATGAPVCQTASAGSGSGVWQVEFDSTGERMATGGLSGSARVWDARTCAPETVPLPHPTPVTLARFSRGGHRLVTAGEGSAVRVWDVAPRRPVPLPPGGRVLAGAFTVAGPRVVVHAPGTLHVWDVTRGTRVNLPLEPGRVLWHAVPSRDGRRLAAVDSRGVVTVWDAVTGRSVVPRLAGPIQGVDERTMERARQALVLRISPDGGRVIAGTWRDLHLWDAATGAYLVRLDGAEAAEFSHDGTVFWRGGFPDPGTTPEGWPVLLETARLRLGAYDGRTARGLELSRARRSSSLLLGGIPYAPARGWTADWARGEVVVYDHFRDGAEAVRLLVQSNADSRSLVMGASFSPGGERLVTVAGAGVTRLWDLRTGTPLGPPLGNGVELADPEFSPDGRLVLTRSRNGAPRLWDAWTGQEVTVPLQRARRMTDAAFDPTGTRILTFGQDDSTWVAHTWELLPDGRSSADLGAIAEFLSARSMDPSGSVVPVDPVAARSMRRRVEHCIRDLRAACGR